MFSLPEEGFPNQSWSISPETLRRAASTGSTHTEFVLGLNTLWFFLGISIQQLFRHIKIIAPKVRCMGFLSFCLYEKYPKYLLSRVFEKWKRKMKTFTYCCIFIQTQACLYSINLWWDYILYIYIFPIYLYLLGFFFFHLKTADKCERLHSYHSLWQMLWERRYFLFLSSKQGHANVHTQMFVFERVL